MLTKLAREKIIKTRSVTIQTQEKTTRSVGIQTTCKQRRRKYLSKEGGKLGYTTSARMSGTSTTFGGKQEEAKTRE